MRALARAERLHWKYVIPHPTLTGPDRLDSWKTIAEYLSRDVATVRRWEKGAGLPIRRVLGSRGHSVFAYRSEIDAWLSQKPSRSPAEPAAPTAPSEEPAPEVGPTASIRAVHRIWRWATATTLVTVVVVTVAWRGWTPQSAGALPDVEVRPDAIVATGPDGVERWRYTFPNNERIAVFTDRQSTWSAGVGGSGPGVVVAARDLTRAGGVVQGGQLLRFSPAGVRQRTFMFNDRVAFGTETYGEPWAITDYRPDETAGGHRIAVAAHHYQWWPSVVTILDADWSRRGTFVNAGWVERLLWMSPDRLMISGFSNAKDGGMVALVDAGALDGQSPSPVDSAFRCTSCGDGPPVRYVVLPRSEVNRVTASPFNRASLEVMGNGVTVRTIEMPSTGGAADALYEFSRALDLIQASYSDRYWEVHRSLEAEGLIRHTREQCPDRLGPPAIEAWEPKSGWLTVRTRP